MEKPTKIMRKSIYTFLQNYEYFSTTAAVVVFPFSVSVLLSQAILPSSWWIYNRLRTLFHAAGFPESSDILSLKISETISCSIFTLPFTLTFLLVAKASIIQALKKQKPCFSSILSLLNPLLLTYICNSFLIVSANATVFSLLFFAVNFLEGSGFSSMLLSAAGAVVYSVVVANALIICNLALVLSGMERCGGYMAILKACLLLRGKTSTALSLALPINLAMAGIEALFQYRILRGYRRLGIASMAFEGMLISYLYSIFLLLDTVVTCMLYKSCKASIVGLQALQSQLVLKYGQTNQTAYLAKDWYKTTKFLKRPDPSS
ncbi:hypothetical protein EZV62_024226 [Acer yangbiense]|uniref:Uncharacterized protein n=1 Tax=Acer yangbiense TaxID=1000413 RepID=A0A5C7H5I7_9ROSI|nr:hypothetical protein EZV62_024226 [Acer yangbiense]